MADTVALVGSSGPLGMFLNEYFLLRGWNVRRIGRSGGKGVIAADVRRCAQPDVYGDASAVVYCAWDTRRRSPQEQRAHVRAAAKWAELAFGDGRTFLFTSTVAAHSGTESSYGRHKLMAEDAIRGVGGVALRIGLIVDDAFPFLATAIRGSVRKHPYLAAALELFVFALSTETVAAAMASEIEEPRYGGCVWLAPETPTSLATVAAWGTGRSPRTFPALGPLAAAASALNRAVPGNRYLDALAGLRQSEGRHRDVLLPRTGKVRDDDWKRSLMVE